MSLFPHKKDTEEAAVNREQALLDRDPKLAERPLYHAYLENGECETSAKFDRAGLSETPLKALVEEKYGIEYEEFTNPWHAAASSFLCFFGWFPSSNALIILFPADYRIPVTVFVVGLSLIFTGYTSAKLGKAPTKQAMLRNLIIGLLTMGVTYFGNRTTLVFKS